MDPDRDDIAAASIPADRDRRAGLSSRTAAKMTPALVLLSVGAAAATLTLQQPQAPAPPSAPVTDAAPAFASTRADPLWSAIDQWNALRQSDSLPFASYAGFLLAHRGWPGETALRRAAEHAIRPDADPRLVSDYFTTLPPLSGSGRVRQAEALAQLGRADEARTAAEAAWTGGALSADDEGRLTTRFAGQLTLADQDQRMERLLWDRTTGSAARQLALVSPGRRPLYAARLAFQTRAPDASIAAAAVGPGADRDAGYVIDRATWLRETAQGPAARAYLAQPRSLDAPPYDAAHFLKALLDVAQGAAHDGQASAAYQIALLADAAFAPGTTIRERPLAERDPYTSLVWLGGQTALKALARPKDAEALFVRYAAATQSPGGQSKGEYWAGRAALAAGETAGATDHFANAARQADQFYGQLATERLGRAIALPAPPSNTLPEGARAVFMARETVRAARLLGERGRWQDQTQFIRAIAQATTSDADHILAGEFAAELRRPDLGVMVSRTARASGARDPVRVGFPTVAVPPTAESRWTIVHALSRQESQFDREAMSAVGARGLMQLMPATAREQAGKLGLPWEPSRLTGDPAYNVLLGSAFFDRMLAYYNGSYVLAVASYNAGPGNVNKFLRANGDPRMPGVDVIDWIEAIPFQETRTYVQKVLENAVVYDLLNPTRARTPERNRLSYYLGKTGAG